MAFHCPDEDLLLKTNAAGRMEEEEESSLTPALERLWAFSCELTAGRNVSSMAWNKTNPVSSSPPLCLPLLLYRALVVKLRCYH